jgi:hypothetical protein
MSELLPLIKVSDNPFLPVAISRKWPFLRGIKGLKPTDCVKKGAFFERVNELPFNRE